MPFDPVEFIERHDWTFAKTMPQTPHEYLPRYCADTTFNAMVVHIRKHGEVRMWGRKLYIYWDCDGWCYWTMGWPVEETTIINRAKLTDSKAHPVNDRQLELMGGAANWSSPDGQRPEL